MAYFPDLSTYSYTAPGPTPAVRNVGWLDVQHAFTRGPVSPDEAAKLVALAMYKTVQQMRGFHQCPFCDRDELAIRHGGLSTLLGSAEIWIPSLQAGVYYAAPDLIVHYVQSHGYQPPDPYLAALAELDIDHWDPDPVVATLTPWPRST
jgi:hypothetical protein